MTRNGRTGSTPVPATNNYKVYIKHFTKEQLMN